MTKPEHLNSFFEINQTGSQAVADGSGNSLKAKFSSIISTFLASLVTTPVYMESVDLTEDEFPMYFTDCGM